MLAKTVWTGHDYEVDTLKRSPFFSEFAEHPPHSPALADMQGWEVPKSLAAALEMIQSGTTCCTNTASSWSARGGIEPIVSGMLSKLLILPGEA